MPCWCTGKNYECVCHYLVGHDKLFFYWWITLPHLCMCWMKMSTFQGITHSHLLWRAKSLLSKASHLALHVLLFIQIWQCPAVSNKILDIYFSSPEKKKCSKDVKTPLWLAPLFLVSLIFSVFQCFCGIVIVVGSRKKLPSQWPLSQKRVPYWICFLLRLFPHVISGRFPFPLMPLKMSSDICRVPLFQYLFWKVLYE